MKFKVHGQDVTVYLFEPLNGQHVSGIEEADGTLNVEPTDPKHLKRAGRVVAAASTAVAGAAGFAALTAVGCPPPLAAGALATARSLVNVDGYYRDDGTYVRGHNRTQPDEHEWNNFS